MLNAVTKLEKELDEHVKGKISELKKWELKFNRETVMN